MAGISRRRFEDYLVTSVRALRQVRQVREVVMNIQMAFQGNEVKAHRMSGVDVVYRNGRAGAKCDKKRSLSGLSDRFPIS